MDNKPENRELNGSEETSQERPQVPDFLLEGRDEEPSGTPEKTPADGEKTGEEESGKEVWTVESSLFPTGHMPVETSADAEKDAVKEDSPTGDFLPEDSSPKDSPPEDSSAESEASGEESGESAADAAVHAAEAVLSDDFDNDKGWERTVTDAEQAAADAFFRSQIADREQKADETNRKKKKKLPIWARVCIGLMLAAVLVVGGGALYVNYMLEKVTVDFNEKPQPKYTEEQVAEILTEAPVTTSSGVVVEPETEKETYAEVDPDVITLENIQMVEKKVGVENILLVGVENIGSDLWHGRSDSMMIATFNFDEGTCKLTSFMRDCYVSIPGYGDNKLNATFPLGGVPLVKSTIEQNFGITIDGCVLVNFDGFEEIIDALGGVKITLSEDEANYLNTTNYISKKKNRKVKAGTHKLNGNQALGYSRVRYVATPEGVKDDFGRTLRQRNVLNAIFNKYKTCTAAELLATVNTVIKYVQTDLTKTQIIDYITQFSSLDIGTLETERIPADGLWYGATVRGMSVLIIDIPGNSELLHDFIYATNSGAKRRDYPYGTFSAD